MLSGMRAFGGNSMLDTLNAVVRAEPPALESPLAEVVKRCMAKAPAQRFQSMSEVLTALQHIVLMIRRPPRYTLFPSVPLFGSVIDHSEQVDNCGSVVALAFNAELEVQRNVVRYAFLRWG